MTIPASDIVNVNGNVLSAGGNSLALNAIFLTHSTRPPIGSVLPFASALDVANFFGPTSDEADMANVYFNGYSIAQSKPGRLYFSQYASLAVSAYLRGINVKAMTVAQLQALSGTLVMTIDTVTATAAIDLSAATSPSDAASIMQTALQSAFEIAVLCTYDTQLSAFVISSPTTGAASSVSASTGTLAGLGFKATEGATLSPGEDAQTPIGFMDSILGITQNWASFTTVFEPVIENKLLFAKWTNAQNSRFAYVPWDTDTNQIVANDTESLAAQLKANGSTGTAVEYNDPLHAAFVCGIAASIDFTQTNNKPTWAFKNQPGLNPSVSNQTVGSILAANGVNFYADYATAAQDFMFFYPGQISGPFKWLDDFFNQVWMTNSFQLALMNLLNSVPSIPYNQSGYQGLIEPAMMDTINAALNYGAIQKGVVLSSVQVVAINNAAGKKIDGAIFQQGWYLSVSDPGAIARGNRASPDVNFWYTSGGAVHHINPTSTLLQ